jgi:sulfoxide reductase catalytic subunit YedY
MLPAPGLISRREWDLPESAATAESVYLSRRALLKAAGVGAAAYGASRLIGCAHAALPPGVATTVNPTYVPGRAITNEKDATTYNNYYEVDTDKDIWQAAQKIPQRPWTLQIDGLCANKKTYAIDDLLKQMPLEQRIYRHRCVEAWAMTVPWSGFALSKLIDAAQPTSAAKYLVFTSLADDKSMPGLSDPGFPWPYTEGLTLAEARNDLAFIGTGMYGKPMPPQDGGPIRLVVPWKYGFKSAKALVRITFTDTRPATFWEAIQSSEYGFWANVNPAVPHPRWSQATERLLGSDAMVPTQIYNGYGAFVAGLYANMPGEKLFM